jgi:ATP-dependent Clp protease ATP-binding subunit ClpA
VDFRNTVLIMTSTLGTQDLRKAQLGFAKSDEAVSYERMKEKVHDALKVHFRPEFLNRIDETIVFHPLDRSQIGRIVDLQLEHLQRLLSEQEITLEVTSAARQQIASEGYDPVYGARPLKRVIQQRLQNLLATELLRGRIPAGGGVRIDYQGDEFTFEPITPPTDGKGKRKDGKGGGTKVETVGVK